jgi:hypothetical protein
VWSDLGHHLACQSPRFRRHPRRGIRELRHLLLHRLDYALISMADVDAHCHRVEVEVALLVYIPEIHTFGALHRDGIHLRLRRPGVEDMFFGYG